LCAQKEMIYVFDARSASDYVCPRGYSVSACYSMHLPSGNGFSFQEPNATSTSFVGDATVGQNPTACSYSPRFGNYLFCAKN
jgi:hypothetical protein